MKSNSTINDELGQKTLSLANDGKYFLVLNTIRQQKNPLTAAWLASFVIDNVGESNQQLKNWLLNAMYNGV